MYTHHSHNTIYKWVPHEKRSEWWKELFPHSIALAFSSDLCFYGCWKDECERKEKERRYTSRNRESNCVWKWMKGKKVSDDVKQLEETVCNRRNEQDLGSLMTLSFSLSSLTLFIPFHGFGFRYNKNHYQQQKRKVTVSKKGEGMKVMRERSEGKREEMMRMTGSETLITSLFFSWYKYNLIESSTSSNVIEELFGGKEKEREEKAAHTVKESTASSRAQKVTTTLVTRKTRTTTVMTEREEGKEANEWKEVVMMMTLPCILTCPSNQQAVRRQVVKEEEAETREELRVSLPDETKRPFYSFLMKGDEEGRMKKEAIKKRSNGFCLISHPLTVQLTDLAIRLRHVQWGSLE